MKLVNQRFLLMSQAHPRSQLLCAVTRRFNSSLALSHFGQRKAKFTQVLIQLNSCSVIRPFHRFSRSQPQMLSISFHRGSGEMERTKSEGLLGRDRLAHCGGVLKRIRFNPSGRWRVKKKQKESMRRTGSLGLPVKTGTGTSQIRRV